MSVTRDYKQVCPQCQSEAAGQIRPSPQFCPSCGFPLHLVAGKYRLQRVLGEGGFGTVYLAEHIHLHRNHERVVKVLPAERVDQGASAARFFREIQLTAELSQRNPHIVRIYDDFGHIETLGAFYVMEYLKGQTLTEKMIQRGLLPREEVFHLFRQLCYAMFEAHEAGIIHRDLKPDNLFIISWNRDPCFLKILDFGIAHHLKDAKAGKQPALTKGIIGTPHYMSPEQCQTNQIDARTDIYSMAVILYELLTGTLPFPSIREGRITTINLISAHLTQKPESLLLCRPDLSFPEQLDAILFRALEKEPEKRYENTLLFWQALEQVLPELESFGDKTITNTWLIAERPTIKSKQDTNDPLKKTDGKKTNLHPSRSSFVGRAKDMLSIKELFASQTRLVTILGPGGTGKTRLAREYGLTHLSEYSRGGVWFFDLTEARSLAGFLHTVAQELNVPLTSGQHLDDSIKQLGNAIRARENILLILDNLEQVLAPAVQCLQIWHSQAKEAHFLLTSREKLKIEGERSLPLAPLEKKEGVSLFLERAKEVSRQFHVKADEEEIIEEIVSRLDGIPLALKLAAARVKLLTPRKLLERLSKRFHILSGSRRDTNSRQGTLRSAIDWSWELLEKNEQIALAQCSIFRGGFSLEAAEEVLEIEGKEEGTLILELIEALVDKSLLRTFRPSILPDEIRFGLYESIREYAQEKLDTFSQKPLLESKHQMFYVKEAEALAQQVFSYQGVVALSRLELDLENVITVYKRAKSSKPDIAVRAVLSLDPFLTIRGPFDMHLSLLEGAIALVPEEKTSLLCRLLCCRAEAQIRQGRFEDAYQDLILALQYAKDQQDQNLTGNVLFGLGFLYREQGENRKAADYLKESLRIHQELENLREQAQVHRLYGSFSHEQGRPKDAISHLEKAILIEQKLGNRRGEAETLSAMCSFYSNTSDILKAEMYIRQALAIHRELGDRRGEGSALNRLAGLYYDQGYLEKTEQYTKQALAIHREVGNRREEAQVLGNLGLLFLQQNRYEESETYRLEALVIYREIGSRIGEAVMLEGIGSLYMEQSRHDEAKSYFREALQLSREVNNWIQEGRALGNLAMLYHEQGFWKDAAQNYQQALSIFIKIESHRDSVIMRSFYAALEGQQQNFQSAENNFKEARNTLKNLHDPSLLVMYKVLRSLLFLSYAKLSLSKNDLEKARLYVSKAKERYERSKKNGRPTEEYPQGAPPPFERSSEVRFAARLLSKNLADQAFIKI